MICNESLENVKNKEIFWLWKPFVPLSKVTLIQGDTGMGKTNLLIKILADLSHGIYPPTLYRGQLLQQVIADPVTSFYISIENGIDDTIAPLFDMMHGDRKYMQYQNEKKGHFILCGDDVREAYEKIGAKVLVVDPWQQFLPERFSTSNNHALRDLICDVQMAAEETGMAVILAGNYNKGLAAEIRRGIGGAELANTLRSVLSVMPGQDPTVREIHTVKMSFIGKEANPVLVRQLDDYNLVYEEWQDGPTVAGPRDAAEDFLLDLLATGPVDSKVVKQRVEAAGLSMRTINRVKKKIGATSKRSGERSSDWSLT